MKSSSDKNNARRNQTNVLSSSSQQPAATTTTTTTTTTLPSPPKDNLSNRVSRELHIRGYVRRDIIGEGSFAKVWRGTFVYNQNAQLAIKVINKTTGGSELVDKFLPRELANLSQIQHPNFIKVYDIFEAINRVFIVMELAPHGSLLNVINTYGAMSESYVRRIVRQLTGVVKYLHNRNICHRDIKCENVLLDADGNVKLTDLGFSRQCRRVGGRPVASDTFCGSMAYAAPEVVAMQSYDPKISDVWSIGCILFMLATGNQPFDDSDVKKLVELQMARDFCKVSKKLLRFIDVDLVKLIYIILDPQPQTRATVVEILNHPWMVKKNENNCPECPLQMFMANDETDDDEMSPLEAHLIEAQLDDGNKAAQSRLSSNSETSSDADSLPIS